MSDETKILKRGEQARDNCWSVEDIFPDDAAWEAEFQSCQELPERIAAYRGTLGAGGAALLEYLVFSEQTDARLDNLFIYALLRHDEDTTNTVYQEIGRAHV